MITLLLSLALAAGAQTSRQSVIEHMAAALARDAGFTESERRGIESALRERFADYSLQIASGERRTAAQVALRMVVEGHLDQADAARIADVAFAAYQAVGRGAPADVVEGIALYGYRKRIPGDRISLWANGYHQMTRAGVPGEVAADLVYNAMEREWDDSVFRIFREALIVGARDRFDLRDYASYLFGHMVGGGRRPGELTAEARRVFKELKRRGVKPDLPPYEGVFARKEPPKPVYEAPPMPAPEPEPLEGPEIEAPKEEPPPRRDPPRAETPKEPEPPKPTPAQLGLAMEKLWPGLNQSARSYLGTPYVWGGATRRGIDCSALTQNSYGENRVGIPRVSRQQWKTGEAVEFSRLREGDLVFFNTMGVGVSHVGMVVSPKSGQFIHASSSKGVVLADVNKNYYKTRYLGARRIVP